MFWAVDTSLLRSFGPYKLNFLSASTPIISRTSSISLIKITSFAGQVIGQYLSKPTTKSTPSVLSFSKKFLIHVKSWALKFYKPLTLCRGTSTFCANYLCSGFKGLLKPIIMADKISSNSVSPLCSSFSYVISRMRFITYYLMYGLRYIYLPYNLCKMVFK